MQNCKKPQPTPDKPETHVPTQRFSYQTYTARKSPEEQDTSRS